MITYNDLPEDIKIMYSKEQCEAIIQVSEKLSVIMGNIKENIRRIIVAIQPTLQEITKKFKKFIESMNSVEKVEKYNIKPKYPPYKPKIKRIMVCRKPIYHHIRSNC